MKAKKKVTTPCLVFPNKDALIASQDSLLCGKPRGQFHDNYLRVQGDDCGCVFKYHNPDDIPDTNVTCEHGNKIIVYTDKPNKNATRYQKIPVVVDIMRWTGENKYAILKFASPVAVYSDHTGMNILNSEGLMDCDIGDIIIKEVLGKEFKFYPCKPDVFLETYEKAGKVKSKIARFFGSAKAGSSKK